MLFERQDASSDPWYPNKYSAVLVHACNSVLGETGIGGSRCLTECLVNGLVPFTVNRICLKKKKVENDLERHPNINLWALRAQCG